MNAIQRLRFQAQSMGNLVSTPQQTVIVQSGFVEIVPAVPARIYVPVYRHDVVYAQRGFFLSFGSGFSIGLWLNNDCDWHQRGLVVWDHHRPRPHDWWHRPYQDRFRHDVIVKHNVTVWRPTHVVTNREHRGWDVRRPPSRHEPTRVVVRPEPPRPQPPVRTTVRVSQPSVNVFVGIQKGAKDVQQYSTRGQQSRGQMKKTGHEDRPSGRSKH